MLSAITALAICVWFYRTGLRSGKSPLAWAIIGGAVYFVVAVFWTLLITPSLKAVAGHAPSGILVWIVSYAYILVGAGSAFLVNTLLNKVKSAG